jgi:AraC-like DNA-binding protein
VRKDSSGILSHNPNRIAIDRDLGLEELAAIAQLSPYHFCRSFKQSTGFTPHQYLIRQRVERAKLLLKDGKMGILEVAIACGFTHQSHLNRHFKRLTGMTPKNFLNHSNFVQKNSRAVQDCANAFDVIYFQVRNLCLQALAAAWTFQTFIDC